jgi:integrase
MSKMASISTDSGGLRRLQFFNVSRKRETVRLGRMSLRDAERIKTFVEKIVNAQVTKEPIDSETARWVAGLSDVLAKKLAKAGLIRPRASAMLAAFIDAYVKGRTDLKPRTVIKFNATKDYLVEFFSGDRPLRDIAPGDADEWRVFLLGKGMGENTVRKHVQIAKQFFTSAVRKKLIEANPFADLKSTVQANPERFHFVSGPHAEKVLAACPDAEWKLIFALSRFGGLRCPSEHLALNWDCIDWAQERIRIPSPKTEHHVGRSFRTIPLFPEIRPHLADVFSEVKPGIDVPSSSPVITRYRDTNMNLRTQLCRIIERAGLEPWPKLFQNLRSTRETELADEHAMHVVCAWIGNSKAVAAKHYLQVTDDHFRKALEEPAQKAAQ